VISFAVERSKELTYRSCQGLGLSYLNPTAGALIGGFNNLNFILAGLNIDRAPVEVLECVAVPTHSLKEHLERLARHAGGGVILSTCNRTEIYSVAEDVEVGVRRLREYIDAVPEHAGVTGISDYIYTKTGDEVAEHLFGVTAGLQSVALGESEILGQVTRAMQAAGEAGTVEPILSRLFHAALRTSRKIRKETDLGRNRTSVSSLGVQELQNTLGSMKGLRILLVGAGEMGKLTARALIRYGANDIVVSSRSMNRGMILAEELGAPQVAFEDISQAMIEADVLITCTAATDPVITEYVVADAMSARQDRHLSILDLGMPRDVESTSGDVANVNLISLAELQARSAESWELRAEAAAEAQGLIDDGVRRFKERLTGIESEPVIRSLGARVEQMRREEVEQTLGRLDGLTDKQAMSVEKMTRSLVRRILADPISFLRSEEDSAAEAVQKVFALAKKDEDELE
jgi:glutamyl-tRNA reductase|tara:strand:+ start:1346 stop:2728 length:1383 start_codon:yes stop_codon:yes gene_type:complete